MKILAILSAFTFLVIIGFTLSRAADSLLATRGDAAERAFADSLAMK